MIPIRLGAAAGAGIVAALALGDPAAAHGSDAPGATNYRTTVTAVTPAVPGLSVRAIEAGARLELTNRTGRVIQVIGYDGEPYVEVRPDGVYENVRSPATYLNATLAGNVQPPATADPALPPSWRRTSTGSVARWHDRRTHWLSATPPPTVAARPDRQHRIRDWTVPLRDGVSMLEVRGTLDWVPPPAAGVWWAGVALGAAALAVLGAFPARSGTRSATSLARLPSAAHRPASTTTAGTGPATSLARLPLAVLALAAVAAGAMVVAFAMARELDAGAHGFGGALRGLLLNQAGPVLAALAAVAAGGLALARRPAADFALALAGGLVALFGGVANAAVLARSVAPVPWPAIGARVAIAGVIAGGVGVALAATLRLRQVVRAATTGGAATDGG